MKSDSEVSDDFETPLATNAGAYVDPEFVKASLQRQENWPRVLRALSVTDPELIDSAGR